MYGISIVVVSYNSEAIIESTLSHLFSQKNTDNIQWEIVFVNNNSKDNTVKIVENFAKLPKNTEIKIVNELSPGTAFARFKGISEAKYEVICFVDDDNRIEENWVSKAYRIMKDREIGILGCGGVGEFEEPPPSWFENEKLAYAIGDLYPDLPIQDVTFEANLPTAGMCIRKEIFDQLNKQHWKPQLTGRSGSTMAPGEDSEICQAARLLGYKMYYTNELNFVHFMPKNRITWNRFLEMTYGFGITDVCLLAYKLEYDKRNFNANLVYFFRKIWYINYLGKKISLLKEYFKYKIAKIDIQSFQKIKARNAGFCETILKERSRFRQSFIDVAQLRKIK